MTTLSQRVPVASTGRVLTARQMLNKVPEVTAYFWIIKIFCTTVGETAADYLNETLGFGLTNTSYVMSALLIAVLVVQFRTRKYVPGIYWFAVVLISVVGTLISDNLVDNLGVALQTTTIAFGLALAATFSAWFWSERTLSIHTIVTTRREGFYWLAILFTFALGTSAGDLVAEQAGLGYPISVVLFAAAIAIVALSHLRLGLGAVLAFWIAYVLTRPLGASIGDLMSQPRADGGLGLGTTGTSAIFLTTILALVVYLSITRMDSRLEQAGAPRGRSALTGAVVASTVIAATTLLIFPLKDVAPVLSLGVLYLLGVLFVSARWGLLLGLATGVVSALAFNFFHRRLLRA